MMITLTPTPAAPRRVELLLPRRTEAALPAVQEEPQLKPCHVVAMEEAVIRGLSFPNRGPGGYASGEQMDAAFKDTVQAIRDKAALLPRFFEGVVRMNQEFRTPGASVPTALRRRTLKACASAVVERMGYKPPRIRVGRGHGREMPIEERYAKYSEALRRKVAALVAALYSTLDRCVEEIVGRINWPDATSCSFTFFREVVICHDVKCEWEKSGMVWTGTHTYRHATHRHDLIDACEHQKRPRDFFMPRRVGEGWGLVPNWLRPHVRFVRGTQIRELIVERDLATRRWEHTERKQRALDPALVLDGGYVLTGWGLFDQQHEAGGAAGVGARKQSAWRRLLSFLRIGA